MESKESKELKELKNLLLQEPYKFDFYQAVKLLELLYFEKNSKKIFAQRMSVGESPEIEKEIVNFKSNVSFEFPASEIFEINQKNKNNLPDLFEMSVNFLSLAGAFGPLPAPYTELILQRALDKDFALKEFLDIFNHRLISTMYRVRKIYRIGFGLSNFSDIFSALIGLGTEGTKDKMSIQDKSFINYTALINQKPVSMSGLETILSDYFQTKVKGKQLVGKWLDISQDQITKLGKSGVNNNLGINTILGNKAWCQYGAIQIEIGPVDFKKFCDFLPEGKAFKALCQIVYFYISDSCSFEIILKLKYLEIPHLELSKTSKSRLGWTSWLKTKTKNKNLKLNQENKEKYETIVLSKISK